jgi:hypothetical protein
VTAAGKSRLFNDDPAGICSAGWWRRTRRDQSSQFPKGRLLLKPAMIVTIPYHLKE